MLRVPRVVVIVLVVVGSIGVVVFVVEVVVVIGSLAMVSRLNCCLQGDLTIGSQDLDGCSSCT